MKKKQSTDLFIAFGKIFLFFYAGWYNIFQFKRVNMNDTPLRTMIVLIGMAVATILLSLAVILIIVFIKSINWRSILRPFKKIRI